MFNLIIKILAILVILSGIIMIYDARPIAKKNFGFGDQNEATDGLKILGYIVSIIGGLILLFK